MRDYVITTERLGLRNWIESDITPFAKMCANPKVMEQFPATLSAQESKDLIDRLSDHFNEFGYTYFAIDLLENDEFIGFAGIKNQTWESEYTPCVDIGWRLKQSAWGKGFATEAAQGCLDAAFPKFGIKEVLSFATDTNETSENVMRKIGMKYIGNVQHPAIIDDPKFKHCVVYRSRL